MSRSTVMFEQGLWYENADGDVWIPPASASQCIPPPGFRYQHSQFPREVAHSVFANGDLIVRGTSSYSDGLVLAMVRPTLLETARSVLRYGWPAERLAFDVAVLRAANLCERCMNAAAHRHGLTWGYRRGSKDWARANTSCGACA